MNADTRLIPEGIRDKSAEAFNELAHRMGSLDLRPLLVYLIDEVNASALPHLAEQFSVDFWKDDLPDHAKRELIKTSVAWHRRKGTPWAVKELLRIVGYAGAEVIEYHPTQKKYREAGLKKLDNTWRLDGSVKLINPFDIVRAPHLKSWAEFAVRINLADASRPVFVDEVRFAVEAAKNKRSWPLYQYYLNLFFQIQPGTADSFLFTKNILHPYPWDRNRLDGSWKLGIDDRHLRLDGDWKLDGTRQLGKIIKGVAYRTLRDGVVSASFAIRKFMEISEKWQYVRVGEDKLRLDGGWRLGKNRILALSDTALRKDIFIDAAPVFESHNKLGFDICYPGSAKRLASYIKLGAPPALRLDGRWRVGQLNKTLKLDGSWKLGATSIQAMYDAIIKKFIDVSENWQFARLGEPMLRLDRGWRLGSNRILALSDTALRKDIFIESGVGVESRSRLGFDIVYPGVAQRLASYVKLGAPPALKLNGTWKLGQMNNALKLDGSWKLGKNRITGMSDTAIRKGFSVVPFPVRLTGYNRLGGTQPLKLNGSWNLGFRRRLKLDGNWNLGQPAGPGIDINVAINKG